MAAWSMSPARDGGVPKAGETVKDHYKADRSAAGQNPVRSEPREQKPVVRRLGNAVMIPVPPRGRSQVDSQAEDLMSRYRLFVVPLLALAAIAACPPAPRPRSDSHSPGELLIQFRMARLSPAIGYAPMRAASETRAWHRNARFVSVLKGYRPIAAIRARLSGFRD